MKLLDPDHNPGIIRGCLKCFTEEPRRIRAGSACSNHKCQGGVVDCFSIGYWNEMMDAKLEEIEMSRRNKRNDRDTTPPRSDWSFKVDAFKADVERLCRIYNLCFTPVPVHHPPYEDAFLVVKEIQDPEADLEQLRNC